MITGPIVTRRIYADAGPEDGYRVLIDGLWPRGMSRECACIDEWCRELAPSRALRRWFGHDRSRWPAFRQRYREELAQADPRIIRRLLDYAAGDRLTLLFAARDTECNHAVVLKAYLEESA